MFFISTNVCHSLLSSWKMVLYVRSALVELESPSFMTSTSLNVDEQNEKLIRDFSMSGNGTQEKCTLFRTDLSFGCSQVTHRQANGKDMLNMKVIKK